jgi:hypothetical protein
VVLGAGLRHSPARDTGILSIELRIGPGSEHEALSSVARLRDFGQSITAEEVETAKDQLWLERFSDVGSDLDLAFQLSDDWAFGRLSPEGDYLSTLYDLGVEEVRDVFEHYMRDRPRAAVLVSPGGADDDLQRALEATW